MKVSSRSVLAYRRALLLLGLLVFVQGAREQIQCECKTCDELGLKLSSDGACSGCNDLLTRCIKGKEAADDDDKYEGVAARMERSGSENARENEDEVSRPRDRKGKLRKLSRLRRRRRARRRGTRTTRTRR